MKAKEFEVKPRNFVAKNAKMGGAGEHKDKKKAEKQGDAKHKKQLVPMETIEQRLARKIQENLNRSVTETALKDKGDLDAKRKALQDLEREPGVDQSAVRQRKLDLEKEARSKGMAEERKANSASARAEFGKRPRKDTLSDKEKDQKKADSDAAWERLMAYADEKKKQGVAEGDNPEYDDEAGMSDNNLETLKRSVSGIDELIQPGDNLPEWCQEKIAIANSMLVTVWDYMLSEKESEHGQR